MNSEPNIDNLYGRSGNGLERSIPSPGARPNTSLDASGDSVFRNLIRPAMLD
jgi:hypothetical protein